MSDNNHNGIDHWLRGRAVCLGFRPDPVAGFLHLPLDHHARDTAVLLCPPFGWEEMCSYRGRRAWATALARDGFPAARIDLPATGDSGGSPRDPHRLEAWRSAISGAAEWLRNATGCSRLATIGIGLGGALLCSCVADGAPIDDLVLWAVPARGRLLLRELRIQAAVVAARHPSEAPAAQQPADGELEAIGFLLTAETIRALEGLDLTSRPLPGAADRRVLLLGRDRLHVDHGLRAHLEQAGVAVTVAAGSDYSALTAHPQESVPPLQTISDTVSWLADGPAGGLRAAARVPDPRTRAVTVAPAREALELDAAGASIREVPLTLQGASGELFGVLTEPVEESTAPIGAVLLNAGALRHVGPNRTWVEIARRWAGRGVPTLRVDLAGIGETAGREGRYVSNAALYVPELIDDTLHVLDELSRRGVARRFVLAGLCSGAHWALHAALSDDRVAGAFMINLYPFFWSDGLAPAHETRKVLAALRGTAWRRLIHRDISAADLQRSLQSLRPTRIRHSSRYFQQRSEADAVDRALDQLRDQNTEALFLLSLEEPLYGQFDRDGQLSRLSRWPNVAVERIPSTDHMFRELWLQRIVHDSLDRALERVRGRVVTGGSPR